MSVGRVCVREVDLAGKSESVRDAARRMAERQVGTLVIVDAEQRPVGVVTDRDVMIRVLVAGRDPATTTVGDIMTASPAHIFDDTAIEAALARMRAFGVRRLPVVDSAGKLVGILSIDDILGLLAEEMVEVGALLAGKAP